MIPLVTHDKQPITLEVAPWMPEFNDAFPLGEPRAFWALVVAAIPATGHTLVLAPANRIGGHNIVEVSKWITRSDLGGWANRDRRRACFTCARVFRALPYFPFSIFSWAIVAG